MKTGADAVVIVLDILHECELDYMLVGSFSSNFHGVARSTQDADLVLAMGQDGRKQLFASLPSEFKIDPQVSFETVTGTTKQVIEIPSIPFKIELFDLSNDRFDQERFKRRIRVETLNRNVYLQTAEDVVVQKLRWCRQGRRSKDFPDVVAVIAVQGEGLDWTYIGRWCAEHDSLTLLEEAKHEAESK